MSEAVGTLLLRAEDRRLAGDYRGGCAIAEQAATLAGATGDSAGQAAALRSYANQLLRLGRQEDAIAACREAVAILEARGDEYAICEVLTVEAMSLNDLGMHQEALEALARGRDIAQRLGENGLLFWVHNRTGVVHGSMGDHELSTHYLMRALTMAEGMDDEARFCILNNVGDNGVYEVQRLRSAGQFAAADRTLGKALDCVTEALRLARAVDHPFRQAISLDNLGMLRALSGDLDAAAGLIEHSRQIAVTGGYRSLELAALRHLARVRLMRGQSGDAIVGLTVALHRALDAGEKPMAMEIHHELSAAYEQTGDLAAALSHYRSFHELEREAHSDTAAARARMAVHHFELDNARLEAENARLEAELERTRNAELAADNVLWQRQAAEDALTGLPNRRSVDRRLPELAAAGHPFCVAVADVDHFKKVNDEHGHLVGDEVLRRIAAVLQENLRDTDLVARFGGEEFLIAVNAVDLPAARMQCELLRAQIAGYPWDSMQPGLAVTISVGLAEIRPGTTVAEGLAQADERLYAAKRAGRNQVCCG
ncbi:tetratricopeptide repeat-containing diguanylate cyclase [Actinoplanes sp. RD1]|uniref:tetratricopeptide repeat-containing diguanylate cyclase n=1 Tax=Actinoplanes sp. RD1 TaxID=3064538 RepID=UPI0027407FDB|nr:GGDEF domain-containing protein [Actinoplanes sp. RD1]